MSNLKLYDAVRAVPAEAQKTIVGGRLKGMTDINPMWRIKTLTEQYGPCGIGWYTETTRKWMENGSAGEIAAFVDILLYVKQDGEWSKGIDGSGGSMFVAKESSGLHTSDECYKMAYTDALSVACKALGIGADVYWSKDKTKYDQPEPKEAPKAEPKADMFPVPKIHTCPTCKKEIKSIKYSTGVVKTADEIVAYTGGDCLTCHAAKKVKVPAAE